VNEETGILYNYFIKRRLLVIYLNFKVRFAEC